MTGQPRPLRVALVTPGFPPDQGGVEQHTGRLAAELRALGLEVSVLTARRRSRAGGIGRWPGRPREDGPDGPGAGPVRVYPAWRTAALSMSPRLLLAGLRAHRRADLVHVHSYHASCAVATLSARRGPVVFTPHYHGNGHSRLAVALHRGYRFVGGAVFRSAHAVVCVSRAERDRVLADFPATAGRTAVVPNGVDTAALRAAAPLPGQPPTVVSLGRLEPYKRVATLVRSVAGWPPDAQLVVIGDGSQRAELEKLAADLGLADRIRFLGTVTTDLVHRWLRTATVLASLSEHEAFGIAPLEAACAGARTVLSDIPAHREITADYLGGTARLVPADQDAVADAVGELLACPGRVSVEVPDWAEIARRTAEIYRSVLTGRTARRGEPTR